MNNQDTVRVLFSCTGVGLFNRGIETFFREAFDGLQGLPGIETRLLTGAGHRSDAERPAMCLARTGKIAPLLGRLTGRSAYAVEQWSSLPDVLAEIRRFCPHVVVTSEANLMFLLRRFRRLTGVPFRVLYSNGGPCRPPFDRHDFVQQVAPYYREEAIAAGEPPEKHPLVPYGIHIPDQPPPSAAEREAIRRRLGLPSDQPVILSVGWIASELKRMDYLIGEVASLPEPRPFLQLLGAMDEGSQSILDLARDRLGAGNFAAASVPPEAVADYYRAADLFVLASLAEGFGRVFLEALAHGLPTIGHRHPVIEYVLGDAGIRGDLSRAGGLAPLLGEGLGEASKADPLRREARIESVRSRFSWDVLRGDYAAMFRHAAFTPMPWVRE